MEGNQSAFLFDDVRVEPAAYKVWKAGAAVPLEPKAFEVLLFLIRNRGRVVQKRELLDEIWKDAFVSENALTREIAQLRKALGEDARRARYIETVPTRGYRFIAEVEDAAAVRDGGAETDGAPAPVDAAGGRAARAGSHAATPSAPTHAPPTHAHVTPIPAAPAYALKREGAKWRAVSLTALAFIVCAAAGLVFWKLRAAEPIVAVRRLTQVTTSTGLDTFPAVSPDGGYVAFSSNRGGRFEIYVRQLAPGGREIQITSDGGNNFQPAWSPDGQFLAYYSQNRGGVWLVPAMGGVARRLTAFGSKPAWSPDGQQIAFQSGALQDLIGVAAGVLPPSTLWVVPARGGPPRQLTKAGVPEGGHGLPIWWPDGKRILFVAYDVTFEEFWSVSVETGELKKHAAAGFPFGDLVFSPDGKYVYVSGILRGSAYGLWRVPVNLENGEPAGEPEKVEGTGSTPIRDLSISADGKRIAYSTQSLASDIWQLPLSPSTGEPAGPPAPLFEDTSRRKTNPAVSPDGRRIAFGVWRMGAPTSVWLVDADGQNPTQLTTDDAGSGVPNWLPDGERLAYVTLRQHRQAFWTRNLKTGDEAPLAELPDEASFPRLSPDGRRVAYNLRRDGRINVWAQEVDGRPRQLTFERELAGFPCWSPDGRWLAFEVKRGDDMQVFVMPAEGGEAVQLTHEPGLSWSHSFSPDGDRVAFAGMRGGIWNLYWVSRTTGEQRQLTHFAKANAYVRYPTWSPAGDRLVFEHAEAAGNVWLMELK